MGKSNDEATDMTDNVMVTVRISEKTKTRLLDLCAANGLKMRWVVEQAILQYCEDHEAKRVEPEKK